MADRNTDLGMIERGALESHAVVAEGLQEGHQRLPVLRVEVSPPDTGAEVPVAWEVAAPGVKVDDLVQGRLAAGMERSEERRVGKECRL